MQDTRTGIDDGFFVQQLRCPNGGRIEIWKTVDFFEEKKKRAYRRINKMLNGR